MKILYNKVIKLLIQSKGAGIMNIDNITLLDVIDRQTLQSLQDAFAEATGMAALATDDTGSVTRLSNPTEFCMSLTRKSSIGCELSLIHI